MTESLDLRRTLLAINNWLAGEPDVTRLLDDLVESAVALTGAARGLIVAGKRPPDRERGPARLRDRGARGARRGGARRRRRAIGIARASIYDKIRRFDLRPLPETNAAGS